jgi:hypothetical protein
MTDVVAVAMISAGSSLVGATVGAVTTYRISLRNSETAIVTTEAQRDVELAKVQAENARLREQYLEEERRNRQATYHRILTVIQRLHGIREDSGELADVMQEWRYCRSGVQIFGSKDASNALDGVQVLLGQRPPDEDDQTAWKADLKAAALLFIDAVRRDIGGEAATFATEASGPSA